MKSLSLFSLLAAASTLLLSCSPLESNTVRQGSSKPVYGPPETWESGGNFTGFSDSRPSANGYSTGAGGAPC